MPALGRPADRRYRALALAHPHVVPLLVTRPLATPLALRPHGTLRPLEDILALLTGAGFSGPGAAPEVVRRLLAVVFEKGFADVLIGGLG